MKNDHKEIWLEPEPPMDDGEVGRMWCQDNNFDSYDYEGNEPTRYVRADLFEELKAKLEAEEKERDLWKATSDGFSSAMMAAEETIRQVADGLRAMEHGRNCSKRVGAECDCGIGELEALLKDEPHLTPMNEMVERGWVDDVEQEALLKDES